MYLHKFQETEQNIKSYSRFTSKIRVKPEFDSK